MCVFVWVFLCGGVWVCGCVGVAHLIALDLMRCGLTQLSLTVNTHAWDMLESWSCCSQRLYQMWLDTTFFDCEHACLGYA